MVKILTLNECRGLFFHYYIKTMANYAIEVSKLMNIANN